MYSMSKVRVEEKGRTREKSKGSNHEEMVKEAKGDSHSTLRTKGEGEGSITTKASDIIHHHQRQ